MKHQRYIIYDGDCPFCTNYIRYLRLRESVGPVELLDARENIALVQKLLAEGFDLDDGMVYVDNENVFHGDDAIHRLALLTTTSSIFNKLNHMIFRSSAISRALYPVLKLGRNTSLCFLRRKKIGKSQSPPS